MTTIVASGALTTAAVDIRPIKSLAVQVLPASSLLRKVLCSEPDKVSPTDFVAKLGTWLALLKEERMA